MQETVNLGIQDLWPVALVLLVSGIGIAFGLDITDDVQTDFVSNTAGCNSTATTSCGAAYNATVDLESGVSNIASKMPTIALVIVAAVLIGILVRNLAGGAR